MSDFIGKCPEMIGYVGDVRNLSENYGAIVDKTNIIQWVIRSKSVVFATLFYSKDDVYHVGSMKQELLKINPNLKFKQISNIEEFIDYVDTGMDRNKHPVKDITMINVYSGWKIEEGSRDYVEEARKRHEPKVKQVSREEMRELVISILLSNIEANATKALTDNEVYQKPKDNGLNRAITAKNEILKMSRLVKNGIGEFKEKRELLTKGIKGLPDVKPQTVKVKVSVGLAKNLGTIFQAYKVHEYIKDVKKLNNELSSLSDEGKLLNCNDISDINFDKCMNISKEQLNKIKIFVINKGGF